MHTTYICIKSNSTSCKSKRIRSMSFKTSFEGFLLLFPYKEYMGNPVCKSISSLTLAPASAFPLNPCSGEKTLTIFTPSF